MTHNKVILITGASSGIGLVTAIYLAKCGMKVYGTSRRDSCDMKIKNGVRFLKMDVTDPDSIQKAVDRVITFEKRIDVLINCAGIGIAGAVEDTSVDEYRQQFDVNLFGVIRVVQMVLPHMRQEKRGRIINISSIGGIIAQPYVSGYCASKFALEGFSESLSMELKDYGIDVHLIEPGDMATEFTKNRMTAHDTGPNSSYYKNYQRVMKKIEYDEMNGANPAMVGPLVLKIIQGRAGKLRYPVGYTFQKWTIQLKKVLRSRFFESLLVKYYS